MEKEKLGLYIHIPFCKQKCKYCDFLSMPTEEELCGHYVNKLLEEIKCRAKECNQYVVSTVFLGGGTPSILKECHTARIMESVAGNFNLESGAEISMECNPGTLTRGKLSCYKESGVNRLSIGLQSAKDSELKQLGRIHTFKQFLHNYDLARKAGFDNINVDVMSALPGQNISDWAYTLEEVIRQRPEHISAYGLMIEEGTPFYETYAQDEMRRERGEVPLFLPTEEAEREMYLLTCQRLKAAGYHRYEISNYAKTGKECRHNIGYWRRTPYLGLGLGSASLIGNVRFSNTADLEKYLNGNFDSLQEITGVISVSGESGASDIQGTLEMSGSVADMEVSRLGKKQQMEEFMFLGLRMTEGISRREFREVFGVELEAVYGTELQKLMQQGMLGQKEGNVYLTEEGIDVSNYVLSGFLLD